MECVEKAYVDRFCRYCKVSSASDPEKDAQIPSTQRQFDMGRLLRDELIALDMEDVELTEHCYVYGYRNKSCAKRLILLAHMDVSPDAPSENVQPIVHAYGGGDITLSKAGITISAADLAGVPIGASVVTSDGTTLLGGDDKAGIAIIMTFLERFKSQDIGICVCFTPDEEIGNGTGAISIEKLRGDAKKVLALTVDGSRDNELGFNTFNAWKFKININGFNIHPGEAWHKMTNAVTLAAELASRITQKFVGPQDSKESDGYLLIHEIHGDVSAARIEGLIRSFEDAEMEAFKAQLAKLVEEFQDEYEKKVFAPTAFSAKLSMHYQYSNMAKFISADIISFLKKAATRYNPTYPMTRGGTDGSRLSEMGLPCPNMWNGTANYHSVKEFNVVPEAVQAIEFLLDIGSHFE